MFGYRRHICSHHGNLHTYQRERSIVPCVVSSVCSSSSEGAVIVGNKWVAQPLGSGCSMSRTNQQSESCSAKFCKFLTIKNSRTWDPIVFSPCSHNFMLAAKSRILKETPQPEDEYLRRFALSLHAVAKSIFVKQTPLTREEFLSAYSGSKRLRYAMAADRVYDVDDGSIKHASSFVKLQRFDPTSKEHQVPRVVSFRQYTNAFSLGRYIRPLEHQFVNAPSFGRFKGYRWLAKTRNLTQRATDISLIWDMIPNVCCVSIDASRFEAHVSKDMLSLEFETYSDAYRGDARLVKMLKAMLATKMHTKYGLKCSILGRRLSGDMCTSLGNALLMCGMLNFISEDLNIDFKIYDDGDDCLLFMNKNLLPRLEEMRNCFKRLGFDVRVDKIAYCLEEIVFCQSHPIYWAPGQGVLCPDPDKHMSALYTGTSYGRSARRDRLIAFSTAMCCLSFLTNIPILGAFHSMVHRATATKRKMIFPDRTLEYLYKNNSSCSKCPGLNDALRVSFYLAFGYTPSQQEQLEEHFDTTLLHFKHYAELSQPVFDYITWTSVTDTPACQLDAPT
ncbi:hypothetical protein 2 [Wenzhou tombus-like virus 10]|uniref:hypothetical protein 2 n=1 Tax=Wenzhou tombus-like virus 10 TaxID=1923663 RepID=UPI00090C577A|nr:hypothetical protein 2 [Wenzhou tombus-like virus 10]APG76633.1 hypothetical protein 2 [Wenzhou tombus-like virus 10]